MIHKSEVNIMKRIGKTCGQKRSEKKDDAKKFHFSKSGKGEPEAILAEGMITGGSRVRAHVPCGSFEDRKRAHTQAEREERGSGLELKELTSDRGAIALDLLHLESFCGRQCHFSGFICDLSQIRVKPVSKTR